MNDLLKKLKQTTLAHFLRHVLVFFRRPPVLPTTTEFKTAFWQSESGAASFIKGTDTETAPAAAIMDAVINRFFLEHCPANSKVLDLGSGHGVVSIFLAKSGHAVTACDVSAPLLKTLEQNSVGLNIQIRQGDAHKIPAADGEFDVIVARMFLGHFPDWPDILAEMTRCCRVGGKLLIHFTSKENADFGREFGSYDCTFADGPDEANPFHFFASAHEGEIRKACDELGLKIRERAPNTFFLHNRLAGHSLGQEKYDAYQQQALEFFKNENVRDFVVWFEQTVIRHMPVWISYYNVLVLEKI